MVNLTHNHKNVLRLTCAQALSMTTMNVNMINTALVGSILAPVAWLSTLPLSLMFVMSMLSTLPVSLLMSRYGRRPLFMLGVCVAVLSTLSQAVAIVLHHYIFFCVASMGLGFSLACAGFYRYAAADSAAPEDKPRAISWVLTGGLVAAFLGPEIARNTVDLVPDALYAGCFFTASLVQLVSLLFIFGVKIPKPEQRLYAGRPISIFLRMPIFLIGMFCAALGYALMSYLMTATPLQVVNVSQLGTSANASIIQWHVVAMFAPSFFTGNLIARYGVSRILGSGVLAYVAVIILALMGDDFWHYFGALFLLGIGWNFLYIGGSSLVAQVANPEERGRVQGVADLTMTILVASASLIAGVVHSQLGWEVMVLAASLPVFLLMCSVVWLVSHRYQNTQA
ncbi:major facilitator superfamily MFS_1 [Candidatus Puniceispirillum marinum IMCC1322]|uniref:Major facilitator superfamily MFS_1 n=2 Tax=Candidatus Puniceispirillum TaxID=767891 RepID=D5BT00_PUNMI|nr:MFS transporter [Candidatus Puniceispirillum marinum]ADE39397.1 major facilitator superfamily MFS_1 [Candidatus Puniceispirillum marinum IMCC1322]